MKSFIVLFTVLLSQTIFAADRINCTVKVDAKPFAEMSFGNIDGNYVPGAVAKIPISAEKSLDVILAIDIDEGPSSPIMMYSLGIKEVVIHPQREENYKLVTHQHTPQSVSSMTIFSYEKMVIEVDCLAHN